MNLEKMLAHKNENLEKLIRNKDEAIRREILKYEEAELCIRLQSECFNLYPVVIKALALQIADDKRRAIFCSVLKGHKLERLAAAHNLTPENAAQEFRLTVWDLQQKVTKGAFTAKESVNISLMHERDMLKRKLQNNEASYNKLQQVNTSLRLANKNLNQQLSHFYEGEEKGMEDKVIYTLEEELALKEEIRKELLEEMKSRPEEQVVETPERVSIVIRWIRWLKSVVSGPF